MSHIFFIDTIEKLNIKKDSSLMMALAFQEKGHEVHILFENDFYIENRGDISFKLFPLTGTFQADGFYLKGVEFQNPAYKVLSKNDVIHMRIDPPYDIRYQRYLWMLEFIQDQVGTRILNDPKGIMLHNEKLAAFKSKHHSVHSFVGSSTEGFTKFVENQKVLGTADLILKPLDLYSGIGVEKVGINDPKLNDIFDRKVKEYQGAIVAQPFLTAVYDGEYRSIYYEGEEVGTIMKRPVDGDFLANIAQGAKFEAAELPKELKDECDRISKEMMKDGISFIAFDLLGDTVTEINVTCPGLLVEVSYALKKNIAQLFADKFPIR